jgi:hypothetical protein
MLLGCNLCVSALANKLHNFLYVKKAKIRDVFEFLFDEGFNFYL